MAVTLQSSGTGHQSSGTTDTQSVVVSAGSNLCLAALVALESDGADSTLVNGITYDGQPLTKLDAQSQGTWGRVEIWYLVNPHVTTANLVTTLNFSDRVMVAAIVAAGVDQSNPFLTPVKQATSGTSSSRTVAAVGAGDLVIDVLQVDGAGHSPVVGADQTIGMNLTAVTEEDGATSTQLGSAGGVMSWTWTTSGLACHIATAFRAAATATGLIHIPGMRTDIVVRNRVVGC